MPIDLQNMESVQEAVATTTVKHPPKTHSKLLTGTGGKVGILNDARNPINNPTTTRKGGVQYMKSYQMVKGIERNIIPVSLVREHLIPHMKRKLPTTAVNVGAGQFANKLFVHMVPHDLEITAKSTNKSLGKRVSVMYEVHLFTVVGNIDDDFIDEKISNGKQNNYSTRFTEDPVGYLKTFANGNGDIENALMDDYLTNYSLYDGVCEVLDYTYDTILEYAEHVIQNNPGYIRHILMSMEHFNFPIETYSDLYAVMQKLMSQKDIDSVKECNTNLMTVAALQALKNRIGVELCWTA
jgi:hypothetical protein